MSKIREYFSRNERNRRTLERGKAPRRERVAAEVTSRAPGARKRINPATGRPRTDDRMMHRVRDESLGRMKRSNDRAAAAEKFGREKGQEYRERKAREQRPAPARQRPGRAAR